MSDNLKDNSSMISALIDSYKLEDRPTDNSQVFVTHMNFTIFGKMDKQKKVKSGQNGPNVSYQFCLIYSSRW